VYGRVCSELVTGVTSSEHTLSFRPFVRMEQLGCQRKDFHNILYLRIFRKSVEKIQVSLKSDVNNGCFT